MKSPPHLPALRLDPQRLLDTITQALDRAGLGASHGPARTATETIRRALSGLGPDPVIDVEAPRGRPAEAPARLQRFTHSGPAGARDYALYVPETSGGAPRPLVVMLHGCTQSPEDFAAGTQMNAWADRLGFVVAYPSQPRKANGARCWNWFDPAHQSRDSGEPAILAALVREVTAAHALDPQRVFVAGLSAGAAMAVVLGETHPELFAAVGAHSGLAYRAAHDVPSALAAMKSAARPAAGRSAVPTIVFHGDADTTVDVRNGEAIAASAAARLAAQSGAPLQVIVEEGRSAAGQPFRCTRHLDAAEQVLAEHWLLRGAAHAWSGGSPQGSFTDPAGPDASAEMLRFFLAQRPLRA